MSSQSPLYLPLIKPIANHKCSDNQPNQLSKSSISNAYSSIKLEQDLEPNFRRKAEFTKQFSKGQMYEDGTLNQITKVNSLKKKRIENYEKSLSTARRKLEYYKSMDKKGSGAWHRSRSKHPRSLV